MSLEVIKQFNLSPRVADFFTVVIAFVSSLLSPTFGTTEVLQG